MGGRRSTSKSTSVVPEWTLTELGDRPALSLSKSSASVNSALGNGSFWVEIREAIASNAMRRIQMISCFSVREPGLLFLLLQYILNVFKFRFFVKSFSMPIESLLTTIFFLETKSLPSIPTKRYESTKVTALLFYREDAQPAKKWHVNNVLPPRRLIAPSLLTTEIVARSKHSSSKKLLFHMKLPKPPKGVSKLTSFRALLAVRMHAALRAEALLALSGARFSVDKRCRL